MKLLLLFTVTECLKLILLLLNQVVSANISSMGSIIDLSHSSKEIFITDILRLDHISRQTSARNSSMLRWSRNRGLTALNWLAEWLLDVKASTAVVQQKQLS